MTFDQLEPGQLYSAFGDCVIWSFVGGMSIDAQYDVLSPGEPFMFLGSIRNDVNEALMHVLGPNGPGWVYGSGVIANMKRFSLA